MPLASVIMPRRARLRCQCSEPGELGMFMEQLPAWQTGRVHEPMGGTSQVSLQSFQLFHKQVLVSTSEIGNLLLLRQSPFSQAIKVWEMWVNFRKHSKQ